MSLNGKQILDLSITTSKLADGILSADAAGRLKMASGYFNNTTTVADKFSAASIGLDRLEEAVIQADGGQAFTADQSMGGNQLTNVGTPVADTDAANKGYVDGVAQGLDIKASCVVATIQNVSLDGTTPTYNNVGGTSARGQITWVTGPTALDGVTLGNGDRMLIKDETGGLGADANGIWERTSQNTWDRATDFDSDAEVNAGAFTFIEEGTVNGDSGWVLTTDNPIQIGGVGGTALAFGQFSGAGSITAGVGLTKTGNTIDVGATSIGLVLNADSIDVAYGLVGVITSVDAGDTAAAGVANTAARSDHQHAVSTAVPTASVDAGDAAVEGVATTLARSDHQHAVTTATAGTIQPDDAAAEGAATSLARSDHTHAIAAAIAGTIQPDDAAAEGVATSFSRSDHTHAIVAAAAVDVGTANAEGASTSFARADHVHRSPKLAQVDKNITASVTAADNALSGATITTTPALDSYVVAFVNGLRVQVGDGTKVGVESYFSGDGGTTARAISAIVATDTHHWNGTVAGYELAATDVLDLDYLVF